VTIPTTYLSVGIFKIGLISSWINHATQQKPNPKLSASSRMCSIEIDVSLITCLSSSCGLSSFNDMFISLSILQRIS